MTVIATDGKTVAADTQSLFGSEERALRRAQKIVAEGGLVFGVAGVAGMRKHVIKWYLDGADPHNVPPSHKSDGWTLMVVHPGGRVTVCNDDSPYPSDVDPPFAIGSGDRVAQTAMLCGKSPAEAVALAIKMLTTCGGEVDVIPVASHITQAAE